MKKLNVRTLSLIVCSFTYLLVGAALFDALESEVEREDKLILKSQINDVKRKHNLTDADIDKLGKLLKRWMPHKSGIQWKFVGAFYYSITVITTIGYGYSTPRTPWGQLFTMVYALCGIPLGLVMFQSIGERLNVFITFVIKNVKRCLKFRNVDVSQTHLLTFTLTLSLSLLAGGAWVFSRMEGWSYIESIYFVFITLTTVGFGDFVALQQDSTLQQRPAYVVFGLTFIMAGLTVLSAAMNLLVLRFVSEQNAEIEEVRNGDEKPQQRKKAESVNGDIIKRAYNHLELIEQQEVEVSSTNGSGSGTMRSLERFDSEDIASTCACSSWKVPSTLPLTKRYRVTRDPNPQITHLMQHNSHSSEDLSPTAINSCDVDITKKHKQKQKLPLLKGRLY